MRCLKSEFGNVRISQKDDENNFVDSVIACSKSVNDAFSGVDLCSGFKRKSSDSKIDGKVIQKRKKNKKPWFEDGHFYSKPCRESLSKEPLLMSRDLESKGTAAGTLQLKMAHCASTERGFNHVLKCTLAEHEHDKKSTFCMIGSNILEDGKNPLITLQKGMQREDLILKSDAEPSQMGVAISPFSSALDTVSEIGMHPGAYFNKPTNREAFVSDMHTTMVLVEDQSSSQMYHDVKCRRTGIETLPSKAALDTIFGRGLHTSLNCCMDTQKNGTKSTFLNNTSEVPLVESGIASFMPHHKAQHKGHPTSKNVEIKSTEAASTSLACLDAFSGRVGHCGSKSKKVPFRQANTSMKQNYLCQVQGGASPIGPKDFSLIWNHANHMDVQGHSEIIKNQCRERAKKLSSLEFREDEILKNLQEKNPQMQKSQSINAEHGISPTGRSVPVGPVGEGLINYASHLNKSSKSMSSGINLLEESCDTKGIFAGSISQGNCSHGSQVTGAGSSWNFDIRSCRWNGDNLGHACPITCLQCLKASRKGQIVSCPMQYREAHNVCFPDVANGPFEIDCSRKFATLSQRHCRNIDSETFKKTNAESPCACTQKKIGNCQKLVGPLDLYKNESMPAMQLLRLVDAGIHTRISANVDENMEFAKQPSFPFNNHFRELSPLNDEIFKMRDTCKESFPAHSGKNHTIGKSWGQIPSGPISNTVAFSVQRGDSHTKIREIAGQVSEKMMSQTVKSQKKMKMKSSSSPIQPIDYKLCGSASGSGSLSKNQGSLTINGLQKGLHSIPKSMVSPLKSQLIVDPVINVEVNKKVGTVWPVKGSYRTEICSVSRNPADFSIPEAGNEFMRGGGNLKCRKVISKRGRPRLRMMKLMALKEPAQK
ncbi:hypothetical protein F0562_024685 [Nyssa sinensis]|uniref:Uncharacterized protein n=1 Tax=Nyssa sinensis TaxID=561372 RepID=A0A5J5BD11_9ASTE|nr:hypothetical protein F0562_024685 [Nyssa sinensis]